MLRQKKFISYASKKVRVKYDTTRNIVQKYINDGTISDKKTPHEKKREEQIQRKEIAEKIEENQEGKNPQ